MLLAFVGGTDRAAGADVPLVGVAGDRPVRQSVDDAVVAGDGQIVGGAR